MQIKERIKGVVDKVSNRIVETKAFGLKVATAGTILMNVAMVNVYADELKEKAWTIINDVVQPIIIGIGAFLAASGIIKMVLAYRNDQPEAQSAAAKDIVIGLAFVFCGFIFTAISGAIGV